MLEIDSLEASPIVSDEVDCADCSVFLANLTVFKGKYASKCEELDVLRVEVAELKSRPALLGACTSCPILHGKIDEMHAYTISLEAKLKERVPTSCSTCEVHALKNLELVHYLNRLQDENDELRKMMGWLSGNELQLRMMMETYKRHDAKALGSEKVGEASGEGGEKIGDILDLPKTYDKNTFAPKPNPLRNKLDTNPDPPIFPDSTDDFQKPIKFKSTLGNVFFAKESEKSSEEKLVEKPSGEKPNEQPQPKPKLSSFSFIVTIVGEMVTRVSFASRGSVRREWRRSGLTRTSTTLPMVYLSLVCKCSEPRQLSGRFRLGEIKRLQEVLLVGYTGQTGACLGR
jgi:hypothetical protein